MIRRLINFVVVVVICALQPVRGEEFTLYSAINAAIKNDPEFQVLVAKKRAESELISQARSALLPRIQFQVTQTDNATTQRTQTGPQPSTSYDYVATNSSLSFSQPLYRKSAWEELHRSEIAVNAAEMELASGLQQAVDRVVQSYIEYLSANSDYSSAVAQVESDELYLTLISRQIESALSSLIDLKKAEAKLLASKANLEVATLKTTVASKNLERITSITWPLINISPDISRKCAQLARDFFDSSKLNTSNNSLDAHPDIVSSRLRFEAAGIEVSKRLGSHYPTLDLVASLTQGKNASDFFIGREISTRAVGIQLVVPIYSGGSVASAVREAIALQEGTESALKNVRSITLNERYRSAAQLQAMIVSLSADLKSLEAADLVLKLEAARLGQGFGSEVELLAAKYQQQAAGRQLMISTAKIVGEYAKLNLAFGTLSAETMSTLSGIMSDCTNQRIQ